MKSTYVFRVYDSNDETEMKIVRSIKECLVNAEEAISYAKKLLLNYTDGYWVQILLVVDQVSR